MMNYNAFVQGLRDGVAAPIVEYLGKNVGYTPAEGEYPYELAWAKQTLAGNASSGILTETISQDSGFLWEATVAVATSTFSVLLREAGKEIQFMNRAVHSANIAGTVQRPGYLSLKPYYFRPNTALQLTLVDLSGSSNDIYFALLGRRLKADPGAFAYTQSAMARMGR
jgi:hypothetical protein